MNFLPIKYRSLLHGLLVAGLYNVYSLKREPQSDIRVFVCIEYVSKILIIHIPFRDKTCNPTIKEHTNNEKICLSCYPKFLTEQKTAWCKNEHNTNMNYRIKKSLAARLRTVLVKNDSTMNYIGCNIQYLREWFEYNFTSEMNWDNYGSYWSIDHIIPTCKFDLTLEDEKLKVMNENEIIKRINGFLDENTFK